jgi:PAS domain S-box-containing protein
MPSLKSVREHLQRVSDARVADIVGAASDAIVSCNADARVVLINAAACRMFGVEHAQAMGSPMQALLGEGALIDGSLVMECLSDPVRDLARRAGPGLIAGRHGRCVP